ncbi:transposase [Streptomyces noursei]|uniref:transposase n=1 Tax=Streptomyces noursei TaxID=1971 RepID=UPI0035E3DA76
MLRVPVPVRSALAVPEVSVSCNRSSYWVSTTAVESTGPRGALETSIKVVERTRDDAWRPGSRPVAASEAVLPPLSRRGRGPWDRRQVFDGIGWRPRTGSPWRDLPERYGPYAGAVRGRRPDRRRCPPARCPHRRTQTDTDGHGRARPGGAAAAHRQHAPARRRRARIDVRAPVRMPPASGPVSARCREGEVPCCSGTTTTVAPGGAGSRPRSAWSCSGHW